MKQAATKEERLERVGKATRALAEYIEEEDCNIEQAISGLLCDIRHLCDNHMIAYHDIDEWAHKYYTAEVFGDG
jgi:hypothetical protein